MSSRNFEPIFLTIPVNEMQGEHGGGYEAEEKVAEGQVQDVEGR